MPKIESGIEDVVLACVYRWLGFERNRCVGSFVCAFLVNGLQMIASGHRLIAGGQIYW